MLAIKLLFLHISKSINFSEEIILHCYFKHKILDILLKSKLDLLCK